MEEEKIILKGSVCEKWNEMICLILNWFFYDPSCMLQFSQFVWTLRSSVQAVFYNFLSIEDAIDREVWLEAIKSD